MALLLTWALAGYAHQAKIYKKRQFRVNVGFVFYKHYCCNVFSIFNSLCHIKICTFVKLKYLLHLYFYSVHASCTNALGQSRSSKNVEELQTLGQVPEAPSNPMDFVHPSNTSVRLDLFMWNKQTCPVEYFIVSYRREKVWMYM